MFSFIVLDSGFLIHRWLVSSDLHRSCTVRQLILLEQISLGDASEWFHFCSDLDLRRNPTVHKTFLQALRNLLPFGAYSDHTLAQNLNEDSLWGSPFAFAGTAELLPLGFLLDPAGASELIPFGACSDRFCYSRSPETAGSYTPTLFRSRRRVWIFSQQRVYLLF